MKFNFKYLIAVTLLALSCSEKHLDNGKDADGVVPSATATVYGVVSCGGKPVSGVVVSDGVDVVQTGKDGVYNLASQKKNSYVFISVPSGYCVKNPGLASCMFWKTLKKNASQKERVDFTLVKENQSNFKMIVMGDIHLYSNTTASRFVSTFVTEVNRYVNYVSAEPVYGLTLGDMTWDWYWYENNFGIEQYLPYLNKLSGISVFNTVGNHDHDMNYNSKEEFLTTGEDWTCMKKYRTFQGPTWFSYNIGGVHFVSLDDAITIDTGDINDKDSRGCWRGITQADMEWLKKDLACVPEETPVVVSVHIPLFGRTGQPNSGNSGSINYKVADMVAPFAKFQKVLFISAHTHVMYNTVDYNVDGVKVTEWNNGAVCGNFWTTSAKGLNLCIDGTPGGYRILSVSNGHFQSVYKGIAKKEDYFFRTYDRNMMNMDEALLRGYTSGNIAGSDADNWVYIRVWDYKPSWKITVKEYDRELPIERFDSYDPLYMLMYSEGKTSTTPSKTFNMFRVKASSKNSPLTVTVTDEFGHGRTENMTRPKPFNIDTYIAEQAE
jgi:hypothetical protein